MNRLAVTLIAVGVIMNSISIVRLNHSPTVTFTPCRCQQGEVNLPPVMPPSPTLEQIEQYKAQMELWEQSPEGLADREARKQAIDTLARGMFGGSGL